MSGNRDVPSSKVASASLAQLRKTTPKDAIGALKVLYPALEELNIRLTNAQIEDDQGQVAEIARAASELLVDSLDLLPMDQRSLLATLAGYWDLKARLATTRASIASATRAAQEPPSALRGAGTEATAAPYLPDPFASRATRTGPFHNPSVKQPVSESRPPVANPSTRRTGDKE